MPIWSLARDRSADAVDVLGRVFPEFPGSDLVDAGERAEIARLLHRRTTESGLAIGRVDVWGDPIIGLAVWMRRPAVDEPEAPRPNRPGLADQLPAAVVDRLRRFNETMQGLRAVARPDRHLYLDELGVLPEHRRQGIASALLEAGHAWADELGLPCALDTDTDENVRFYERRGYEAIASERVPGSDLVITAMRRR